MRVKEKQSHILPDGSEVVSFFLANFPKRTLTEVDDWALANGSRSRKDAVVELLERGMGQR